MKKIFIDVLLFAVLLVLVGVLAAVPTWLGWNYGLCAGVPGLRQISFWEGLALAFLLSSVGAASRSAASSRRE